MLAQKVEYEEARAFEGLDSPKRYKVYYGGRGGAKSWQIAQALVIQGIENKLNILCTREIQDSIKGSVHKLLSDTIQRLNLDDFYEIIATEIRGRNGTSFIFEGLKNNTRKIKSMEGIDRCWCEEAEAISEESWDLLIPTIRKSGSEIWVSFNPNDDQDATYQKYITPYESVLQLSGVYEDDIVLVRKVTYRDNPWFPAELRQEMEDCKLNNHKKYLHIWEGQCNADYEDSIIQPEWVEASIDAHIKLKFKPTGVKSLGFDPADEGSDAKAVVQRHGSVVVFGEQWLDGDLADAIDRAFETAYDRRCTDFVYDSIGVGAGVKVKVKHSSGNEKMQIEGFCASDGVDNPQIKYEEDRTNADLFLNKRAQYWWYLRDRFERTYRAVEKGEYINPDDLISLSSDIKDLKVLKSELVRVQRKRANNTKIQIESKQDMKSRKTNSPNLADALVYSFANRPPKTMWDKPLVVKSSRRI